MAGGSGERFWPLSQPGRPKQLLNLTHPTMSMLEEAVERAKPLFGDDYMYLATSLSLREPITQSNIVPAGQVLSEPARRNTLGGHCWVVANLLAKGLREVTLSVLTSDHLIGEPHRFLDCLRAAMEIAEETSGIVTLGIKPTRPETGYGYIEEDLTNPIKRQDGRSAFRAKSFREKPSEETAESFVAAGRFVWNSGMFFYTIPAFLTELRSAQPEAYELTLAIASSLENGNAEEARVQFERLSNISIDYAVMERSENVFVLRADFPWDDVGAWDAVERTRERDQNGNVVVGPVMLVDTNDCIVLGHHPDLKIGVLGLSDMVIVLSDQALLVCHKRDAQRVRLLAQKDFEQR